MLEPLPPLEAPLAPTSDERGEDHLVIAWPLVDGARDYELELQYVGEPVLLTSGVQPPVRIDALGAARGYRARVRALADNDASAWSAESTLWTRPVRPQAPRWQGMREAPLVFVIQWTVAAAGQQTRVDVARQASDGSLELVTQDLEPEGTVALVAAGSIQRYVIRSWLPVPELPDGRNYSRWSEAVVCERRLELSSAVLPSVTERQAARLFDYFQPRRHGR